jgi:hypothetical protein
MENKIVNSIKIAPENVNSIIGIDENGDIEFITPNFGIIEILTVRNDSSTGVPSIINGAFNNDGQAYGAYYNATPTDEINLVSLKTFDPTKTYVVTINAVFDDFAAYWGAKYGVTLSHYGTEILEFQAGGTKYGGSGHGYEKMGKDFVAHFLWQPEISKTDFDLTISKTDGTTSLLTASVTIQEYVT